MNDKQENDLIEKPPLKKKIANFFGDVKSKIFKNKPKKEGSLNRNKRNQTIFIVVMLAIPAVHWLVFWLYINIQTIALAFQDVRTSAFTFDNFKQVWTQLTSPVNNSIGIALKNTLKYFGTTVLINIPLSLVISFFIYKRIAGYKFFRIMFYLPAIISGLSLVTAYTEFINPNGPLGAIVKFFGGTPNSRSALGRPETATTAILIYFIWTGFTTNVLLFTGGMSRIPVDILEAAKLDGCGPARELTTILFPLIWPTFSTQLIFTMTGLFNSTGPILLFTNGQYETSTLAFWIFSQVYGNGVVGGSGTYNLVSCAGLCFTIAGVPLILLARKLVNKVDAVEY